MNERDFERKTVAVKARNIHPSSLLPSRMHGTEVSDSVKATGIQQWLIVRPLTSHPGEYELIDGLGRLRALDPEQEIYVDVREKAVDSDVFRISEATFKRTERSTAETAAFYGAYLEAVKKETNGKDAQQIVARDSCISKSQLCMYLAINQLFVKLHKLNPETMFERLKKLGINKLYKISELEDNPNLLEVAKDIEENVDHLTLEGISAIVQNASSAISKEISEDSKAVGGNVAETLVKPPRTPGIIEEKEKSEPENQSEPTSKEPFAKILNDLAEVLKEMEASLSVVRSRDYSERQLTSPKTRMTLQKMLTSIRRLSNYVRALQEDSDIEQDSQASRVAA